MGAGDKLAAKLQKDFESMGPMAEPEQSIKDKVAEIVQAQCAGEASTGFIVRANGHQYRNADGRLSGSLKVEIETVQLAE
jgi:hypothetical protein